MKKIITIVFFVLISGISLNAQVNEGFFSYKMDVSTDNPDMQMAVGMLQGSTMNIYFKEKKTRTEMKMGTMMSVITISNETSGDVLMLMSGMAGKNAIKSTLKEIEESSTEKPKVDVELIDETKTIEGYTCKKAIITDEEGNATVYWYTEEINISKKGHSYLNEEVPGFPMQYEINNNGLKMLMTVTKFEKKLEKKSDALFEMTVPEGYKIMTMEEVKKMGN